MLDVPKLGLALLNNAISHIAETVDDSATLEDSLTILETCKALVGGTTLKRALTHTSQTSSERVQRERDVQKSLMEAHEVRRMF